MKERTSEKSEEKVPRHTGGDVHKAKPSTQTWAVDPLAGDEEKNRNLERIKQTHTNTKRERKLNPLSLDRLFAGEPILKLPQTTYGTINYTDFKNKIIYLSNR